MNNDNLLVKDEKSGALLSKALFSNKEFAPLLIENVLIHQYENGHFIIIDNQILDEKSNPKIYKDLSSSQKERISKITAFKDFCEKKSGKLFDISINFVFHENSKTPDKALTLLIPGEKDLNGDLVEFNKDNYKIFLDKKHPDTTHIDKILFLKHNNKAFIFEFMPNSEEKTSQEYFNSNIDKVESLYNFGKSIQSQLFLVSQDIEQNKVLCMKINSIQDEGNHNSVIQTKDIKMNKDKFVAGFEQKFLGNQAEKAAEIVKDKKNKLKPPKLIPGQESFKF